jgi:hypothetical protein
MSNPANFVDVYEECKRIFLEAKTAYKKLENFSIGLGTLRGGSIANKTDFDTDDKLLLKKEKN